MRISQGWQTSLRILLKCGVFSWVMPWRLETPSFHMISNRAESQSYLPLLSTLFWLAYLTEVLIRVRGRGCIFNPSAKEGRFISVQVMEGGRKRENMARDQLHSMRQWCLEESVTKKKTNQSTVTLQSRTSSTWGWCMVTQATEHYLPNLRCIGLSWSSRFIVLSLVHHWAELWGILGNKIFIPPPQPCLNPINCLLYLSKQKTQRQRKIELWDCLSSHPPVSIQSVVHTVVKKKKQNKNNPRYSHEYVNIFAPVFFNALIFFTKFISMFIIF